MGSKGGPVQHPCTPAQTSLLGGGIVVKRLRSLDEAVLKRDSS